MKIKPPRFEFSFSSTDLEAIRGAILRWGKSPAIARAFDGGRLQVHMERWLALVETDWSRWDISEYDHDIGCRTWIQIAIEFSSATTREQLEKAVAA